MSNLTHKALLLAVVLAVGSLVFSPWVQAQTSDTEGVTVSLRVPTNDNPTTPILISPPNNSYVTTSLVTFVWQGSTDSHGIGEYELYLDGSLYFDNIPTSDTDNSEYTLTYNSTTNEYTLVIKSPLAEGSHTWKISAVDTLGSGRTDSATWTFIVDTQAPSFIITDIGDAAVTISAQDITTIPSSPVELTNNEPLLQGTGEANSTVILTVTIPGDPTQTFTFTIDAGGSWSQQLGILPRGVVMTLDFVITDLAGNVSVLSGVQFIITQEVIVFPPVSPSPSASPEVPLIAIPITPPREILFNLAQEIFELLPDTLKTLVASIPPQIRNLGPISTALVIAAIPLLATASIATQFGVRFSLELLARILQALGLVPAGKPRGFVFDSHNHKGIPFALLTITSVPEKTLPLTADPNTLNLATTPLIETVVSDVEGVYKGVELPPGKYQIDVRHQEYRFPTIKPRPAYLTLRDFYKGLKGTFLTGSSHQH